MSDRADLERQLRDLARTPHRPRARVARWLIGNAGVLALAFALAAVITSGWLAVALALASVAMGGFSLGVLTFASLVSWELRPLYGYVRFLERVNRNLVARRGGKRGS